MAGAEFGEVESDDAVIFGIGVRSTRPASSARSTSPTTLWCRNSRCSATSRWSAPPPGWPADREEQLVLGGRDAGVDRLLLAPVQEAAQLVAERQEAAA